MWFIYALIATVAWGVADVFYKKSATPERYSHLKTTIVVGLVMGIHAIVTLFTSGVDFKPINLIMYAPVSLMYIGSMAIGYLGLRYLEVSVSSPVQNTSGALCCLLCLIILGQSMDWPSAVAVVLMCLGVFALGLLDYRSNRAQLKGEDKKYRLSALAFLLPIAYCFIDAMGTFLDAFYLDDVLSTPLVGVTEQNIETVANLSYEFTFLLVAIVLIIYVFVIKKQKVQLPKQKDRLFAALFETAGQFVYVYAIAANAAVAAPMIASYSIVSVILGRIFLKEKLSRLQYISVGAVILGIVILGIVEGA